jgi:hypothetical protein
MWLRRQKSERFFWSIGIRARMGREYHHRAKDSPARCPTDPIRKRPRRPSAKVARAPTCLWTW